jgi:hypothetical protein
MGILLVLSPVLPVLVALAASITPVHSTKLFNGHDLDGWYVWLQQTKKQDPKAVFTVRDKELRISGEDWGGLTTNAEYRDYHLIVEWRWGGATWGTRKDKARDSGILVHGAGADGAYEGRWLESIESQIIEGGAGDFIVVPGKNKPKLTCDTRELNGQLYWQRGGKGVTRNGGRFNWFGRDPNWTDTLGFRGEHDVEKATGKWNRQEVVCDGNRITNIVNGVIVAHGYDATHTSGKIQIQSEGAEIFFRRVEIRPLKDSVKRWIQRNASTLQR